MKGRVELLSKMWEKEYTLMIMELAKIKHKTKKQKDLLNKVKGISDAVRDMILYNYIEKCKHQNAIHFFEWRKKYKV